MINDFIQSLFKLNKSLVYILILLLPLTSVSFAQDVETIWGNWYRADTFLPIRLSKDKNESIYKIKNKYTEDFVKFTNDKPIESLLKISHDATLVEIHAGKNIPKVFPLNVQILQTNKALIVIANQNKKEIKNEEAYASISIDDLPELGASYQMVDVILLTKEYVNTLNSFQVDALRNWVFLGGTLYFDQQKTMLQHATLTVEILKPIIKKDIPRFSQLPEDERKKIFHQYAQKVFTRQKTTSVLNGKVGLFSDEIDTFAETALAQNKDTIKWHLRANQNNFKKKSKIKTKIEYEQTKYLEKLFAILFFAMLGTTLIKWKYSFIVCSSISAMAVIPIIFSTPVLNLDGHLEKFIFGSKTLNYQAKTEIFSIAKRKDLSLTIDFEKSTPFFCFTDCKIKFNRDNQNKFQSMEIKSNEKELILYRKSFDFTFYATAKAQNNKPEIYMNQNPKQVYVVQESKVTELKFEASNNKDIIKINTTSPAGILDRDSFAQELWYPETNRVFYSQPIEYNSLVLVKGTLKKIPFSTTPALNIQETEYSILLPND